MTQGSENEPDVRPQRRPVAISQIEADLLGHDHLDERSFRVLCLSQHGALIPIAERPFAGDPRH